MVCAQACSNARLIARTVALARLGKAEEASQELVTMVEHVCASDADAAKADPQKACSGGAAKDPVAAAGAMRDGGGCLEGPRSS